MRLVVFFCLLLSFAVTGRLEAADSKYALVIGNAKYPDSESPLREPVNDMRAMADELKRAGFEVAVGENLTGEAMRRAINTLYDKIKPGAVAMIFFSGYGIQSGRQSFMIPVDGAIWDEKDVRRDGVSLDSVLSEMNSRGASVKIAILDASRRNPFERRFRQFSSGLAPVTAPRGTLVMYSAPPGTVVGDATSDRSLFVTELLKEIRVPNLTAEEAFNRTRVGVSRVSKSDQIPWFSSSLAEEFSFGPRTQASLDPKPIRRSCPSRSSTPSEPRVQVPEPKLTPPEPKLTPPEPKVTTADAPARRHADAHTYACAERSRQAACRHQCRSGHAGSDQADQLRSERPGRVLQARAALRGEGRLSAGGEGFRRRHSPQSARCRSVEQSLLGEDHPGRPAGGLEGLQRRAEAAPEFRGCIG